MTSFASLYINHGEGLHVGGGHHAERLDGVKNTDVPKDRRRRDVIRVHYITIWVITPEDDASTVLPDVVDSDIPGRVAPPCDGDGTVSVHGGFLAAQNACGVRARLDFDAMLHVNHQLCASTRECVDAL